MVARVLPADSDSLPATRSKPSTRPRAMSGGVRSDRVLRMGHSRALATHSRSGVRTSACAANFEAWTAGSTCRAGLRSADRATTRCSQRRVRGGTPSRSAVTRRPSVRGIEREDRSTQRIAISAGSRSERADDRRDKRTATRRSPYRRTMIPANRREIQETGRDQDPSGRPSKLVLAPLSWASGGFATSDFDGAIRVVIRHAELMHAIPDLQNSESGCCHPSR